MMTGIPTLQKEIRDAIADAEGSVEALEFLLKKAQDAGGANSEIWEKVSKAKKGCKAALDRFITAYQAYNNLSST